MNLLVKSVARMFLGLGLIALSSRLGLAQGCDVAVLSGGVPTPGIGVGVNTSDNKTDFLSAEGTADLVARYPGCLLYGVFFFSRRAQLSRQAGRCGIFLPVQLSSSK